MSRESQLQDFINWWQKYGKGDEKGEAQIFLDHFFSALGYPDGLMGAQGNPEMRIKFTVADKVTTKFADLVIEGRVLIEMKKRGEDLSKHHQQAFGYWSYLTPHPRYMVLCNFDEFWVYDMERQVSDPMGKVPVDKLAEDWGPLAFLFPEPESPVFNKEFDLIEITQQAAESLAAVFRSLTREKRGVKREHAQRFILQCMVALFAEDINLLPRYTFTRVVEDCINGAGNSFDLLLLLFTAMNLPGAKSAGRFYGVDYFNGGLFQQIYPIALSPEELRLMREAANHNWSRIRPAIFGTIFEDSMDAAERHQTGAHFTSDRDIMRIVEPVIVRPWREQIEGAKNAKALHQLHEELCHYIVLDPACGSGNFLYIAYREMKKLEQRIFERLHEAEGNGQGIMGMVSARQFYGFDTNPFAVELAKVTLMIAKKLAVDELHSLEHPLPLDNLDTNIKVADALLTDWPEFDACIGNPPYMGAKRLKQEHKPEYINRVRDTFPDVPGNADYCVYWFNKAHKLMKAGARAGLVGTNTIRQNYSREGGLDVIVANGGTIYEAVGSTPWSGEAKVHISIACWSKGDAPYAPARLWTDGETVVELANINSSLSVKTDVTSAKVLDCNTEPKRVFQGQTPGHDGFVISSDDAHALIKSDKSSKEVICSYLTGDDILSQSQSKPSRYIIDFEERDIVEARNFKVAFKRLEKLVLPDIETKAKAEIAHNSEILKKNPQSSVNRHHQGALQKWWQHFYSRTDRKEASKELKRYIVCSRVTKRPIFDFVDEQICPSDALQTFAFADDYSFGILQSNVHWEWFIAKASTLKADYRYTPNSVFDTFPWPQQPTNAQVKAVAEAGRKLHEYRRTAMAKNPKLTLRELYRSLELPGKNPLKDLHAALDAAVLDAYGFMKPSPQPSNPHPPPQAGEGTNTDVLSQLLALNEVVAAKIEAGEAVTAPGVPKDYPNPAELVSEGCITPPEWV
ncbi:MAG: N-6 DNA methylase [Anaerolineaceae bacterium]|nr:N-6 DNA methylase [Anaerolineaceae bacterium]